MIENAIVMLVIVLGFPLCVFVAWLIWRAGYEYKGDYKDSFPGKVEELGKAIDELRVAAGEPFAPVLREILKRLSKE